LFSKDLLKSIIVRIAGIALFQCLILIQLHFYLFFNFFCVTVEVVHDQEVIAVIKIVAESIHATVVQRTKEIDQVEGQQQPQRHQQQLQQPRPLLLADREVVLKKKI
jgi:hypothetical protein